MKREGERVSEEVGREIEGEMQRGGDRDRGEKKGGDGERG